jgi:hypothetical protein
MKVLEVSTDHIHAASGRMKGVRWWVILPYIHKRLCQTWFRPHQTSVQEGLNLGIFKYKSNFEVVSMPEHNRLCVQINIHPFPIWTASEGN